MAPFRPLAVLCAAALALATPRLGAVEAVLVNLDPMALRLRVLDPGPLEAAGPFRFACGFAEQETEPAPFPKDGLLLPESAFLRIQVDGPALGPAGASLRLHLEGPGQLPLGSLLVQFVPAPGGAFSLLTTVAGRTHVALASRDRTSLPGSRVWFLEGFQAVRREAVRLPRRTSSPRAVAPAEDRPPRPAVGARPSCTIL